MSLPPSTAQPGATASALELSEKLKPGDVVKRCLPFRHEGIVVGRYENVCHCSQCPGQLKRLLAERPDLVYVLHKETDGVRVDTLEDFNPATYVPGVELTEAQKQQLWELAVDQGMHECAQDKYHWWGANCKDYVKHVKKQIGADTTPQAQSQTRRAAGTFIRDAAIAGAATAAATAATAAVASVPGLAPASVGVWLLKRLIVYGVKRAL